MNTKSPIKHPDLHAEILAFCAHHGVTKTRFGVNALRDPSFFASLEAGRELRRATIDAVRRYMVTGEPVGVAR